MSDSKPCDGTCELAAARRRDAYNALVHERDRLLDKVEAMTKQLEAMAASQRHFHSLICDRCGTVLTVSASFGVEARVMAISLYEFAYTAGWLVSNRTFSELGLDHGTFAEGKDLCLDCAQVAHGKV